jgi:hypothetical protein
MSVNVCLPLFGTPAHELEADKALTSRHLRTLGDELRERLQKAADLLDKLKAAGWSAQLAMYELILAYPGVETRDQAEERLRAIGVDPAELMVIEEVDEEDELES